jgi:hypothetical protein
LRSHGAVSTPHLGCRRVQLSAFFGGAVTTEPRVATGV